MTRSRRCCLKGILTSTMLPLSTFSLTYVWIPASGSPPEKLFPDTGHIGKYAPVAAFCDIDKTFVCGYERFLCSMGMKANTIVKHMKHLKKALRQACLKGYSKHSIEELFSLCSVKPEKTFRESLTTKELVVLYQFLENNFDTMEEKEREILSGFLFSCLTGLRYSDICSVEYSNIKRIRNKRWLFLTMKKTSQKVFIPIEQMFSGKALGIMRLFHRTRGKLFHMPSNAICNRVIKRVYKKLFRSRKTFPFTALGIVSFLIH